VKVATGLYTADFIPGNNVTDALADLKVAMWTYPGFAVICVRADARLGCVLDTALYLAASKA
jgi:hypothetical protein